MRFTIKLFALVSSLALGAAAQNPSDDSALRDALRKALQGDAPATVERPATAPVTPAVRPAPLTPRTPETILAAPPTETVTYQGPPQLKTALTTNGMVAQLSLREAIELALVNNLQIQTERYTPIILDYNRRALYGYYDPIFNSSVSRSSTERESGGFNQITGNPFPGTTSDIDSMTAGLGGWLPTGMRYDIGHTVNEVDATAPVQIGTNSFGQPIFGRRRTLTYNSGATISAQQPLLRNFWIDAPRLAIRLARRDVRISELQYERIIMDVIKRVEQAYYDLIAARELIRVGESDVAVKKQFFDEQHRRVEVGTLAPLEEKLAQAELAAAQVLLIAYRRDAANAESILKGLIDDDFIRNVDVRLELNDRLLALPEILHLHDAFRDAVENRPDLHAARVRLERQQVQLKYTFNQLFPSLDVFATYGANGLDRRLGGALDDIANRTFPNHSFGLALSLPLTMHTERQRHKAAKAELEQLILAFKQLEEFILQEVEVQLREVLTAWNSIPLRREQTVYQQAALEAEQKKLAAGKSTSFNVLSIASALTAAQANEIGTLRDYNKALAELSFRKGTTLQRWRIDQPVR